MHIPLFLKIQELNPGTVLLFQYGLIESNKLNSLYLKMKSSRRSERADNEGSRPLDIYLEKRMSHAETLFDKSTEWFTRRM